MGAWAAPCALCPCLPPQGGLGEPLEKAAQPCFAALVLPSFLDCGGWTPHRAAGKAPGEERWATAL